MYSGLYGRLDICGQHKRGASCSVTKSFNCGMTRGQDKGAGGALKKLETNHTEHD